MTDTLRERFSKIPWSSFGRQTPVATLARSVLPVGNFPGRLPSRDAGIMAALGEPDYEKYLMDIQGTAFQVGRGKLVTCWHVCEALKVKEGHSYIQTTHQRADGVWVKGYWPVESQFSFVDPRIQRGNPDVDIGILISTAVGDDAIPYDVPPVTWGDSTQLGVGDRVLIGGYPLGKDMFLALSTNRGIVQPTFYDGIVSAIIPATKETETRLIQISTISMGGISGGVVCDPTSGTILGMVTSGLETAGQSMPITYAIPSEVIQPYAEAISFKVKGGEVWR
ncbi:hypothetical protein ABIB80_007924 [Bradyrhizobium sp. i1.15.2]|uniref:serine protease n=2 Tax=Bradyrhizobium TaxID=374 RepID=UPI0033962CD3